MASAHCLATVPDAKLVCVSQGIVSHSSSGTISILRTDADGEASLVFLLLDTFSYPLVDQTLMKSSERVYILPAGTDGAVNYVLSLPDGVDTSEFETQIARFAQLRSRTGEAIRPSQPSAAVEELFPVGAPAAAPAPSPGHGAIVTTGPRADGVSPAMQSAVATAVAVGSAAVHAAHVAAPHVIAAANSAATVVYNNLPQSVKDVKAADVGSGLSGALLYAGSVTKSALISGATIAGTGVKHASSALATQLGTTAQPMVISNEARSRAEQARTISKVAVTVSASLVMGAATVAKTLGSTAGAAFMATNYGKRLAEAGQTESGKAARQVAASSIVAASEVWHGLETAALVFSAAAGEATTDFVHKRYGAEAGALAATSVEAATDAGIAVVQVGSLGAKTLIGRTAAEAAREVVVQAGPSAGPTAAGGAGGAGAIVARPSSRQGLQGGGINPAALSALGPMGMAMALQQQQAAAGGPRASIIGMGPVGADDGSLLAAATGAGAAPARH